MPAPAIGTAIQSMRQVMRRERSEQVATGLRVEDVEPGGVEPQLRDPALRDPTRAREARDHRDSVAGAAEIRGATVLRQLLEVGRGDARRFDLEVGVVLRAQ